MDWFGRIAVRLARNPLGVIALFIVLVYAISGWVITQSVASLNDTQKTILILFLVIFPCVILFAFYRLVAYHHTKLYAPIDYRDDQAFLTAAAPARQGERLKEDLEKESLNFGEATGEAQGEFVTLTQDISLEEDTVAKVPSSEVADTASTKTIIPNPVHSAYLAETLVLQDLENEFGYSISRNVTMGAGGQQIEIDGVINRPNGTTFVEIKFLRSKTNLANTLRLMADQIEKFSALCEKMRFVSKSDFIFAIVVEGGKEFRNEVEIALDSPTLEAKGFEIRVYSLEDLLEKYGLS